MEHECRYVSSRGIMKSCHKFQSRISSSNPHIYEDILAGVKDGDSVYVCTAAVPTFARFFLPRLTKNITLVTGDADESAPHIVAADAILSSPYIVRWFAQNCVGNNPKLHHIPIGMDYHTLSQDGNRVWGGQLSPVDQDNDIHALRESSPHFSERERKCYTTFHFQLGRGDRHEAYNSIPKDLVYYEPTPVTRAESHAKHVKYAFVVSPYGGGPDCHRTWEALALGCIPIMKSCGLDPLFAGLPVLLVKSWSDVTQELLDKTVEEFKGRTFNYEKLTLAYWVNKIRTFPTTETPLIPDEEKKVLKHRKLAPFNILGVRKV
jgi:hypothetical protein